MKHRWLPCQELSQPQQAEYDTPLSKSGGDSRTVTYIVGLPYGTRGGVGGGLDKPLDEMEGGVGVESQSK